MKPSRIRYAILTAGFLCYVQAASVISFNFRHLPSSSIFDLQFLYGPLIKSIVTANLYASPDLQLTGHRMPFVPYFLSAIALVRNDVLFAYAIKNLIFCSLTWFTMSLWWAHETNAPRQLKLLTVLPLVFVPQLIFWGTSPDADEGYLIHLLAALSIGLFFFDRMNLGRKWYALVALAVMNALLFLTKSNMLLVSVTICCLFWLKSTNVRVLSVFAGLLLGAVLLWGLMNLRHSGTFAITSSIDGWNLYKGNNEAALAIYPPYNLDILDDEGIIKFNRPSEMDEWEFNGVAKKRALEFAKNQPLDELRLLGRRLFILLFEVRRNPLYRGETRFASPIYWVGTFCMIVFRLILLGSLWAGVKRLRGYFQRSPAHSREHTMNTVVYFSILLSYTLPYLAAFVYERHLMPLVIPTVIYFVSSAYFTFRPLRSKS